jgi:hypothetical protein
MTDSGHLRTSFLDAIQAEDRQSRPSADITITILEAHLNEAQIGRKVKDET